MKFPEPHYIETNGIRMAVYEQGPKDGMPVVLCHGWPELAYSWRHQIPALAAAGFRVIAPDQRGYGNTGGPKGKENVTLYDIEHLAGDLMGLLDALDIDKAVFCGHDWGGIVVWQAALLHPDRMKGVIGVNTPFIPRLTMDPIAAMRAVYGDDMYIVFFQKFGEAEKLLGADTARALRFFYRRSGVTMKEWEALPAEAKNLAFLGRLRKDRLGGRHQLVSQLHPQLGEERGPDAEGERAGPDDLGRRRRGAVARNGGRHGEICARPRKAHHSRLRPLDPGRTAGGAECADGGLVEAALRLRAGHPAAGRPPPPVCKKRRRLLGWPETHSQDPRPARLS